MSKNLITAIILIYCSIFVASSIYVMIPIQPLLAEKFDVSLQVAALSSTMFVFPYAFGLVFFGLLADRFSLRKLLLAGMASLSIITYLLSFSNSIYLLLFLRSVQGVLAASFAPVTFAYCFQHFNGSFRAFVIAMINTGFLFAGVFGQMISAFFADWISYPFVFVAFFCFYLSCFIGLFFTLKTSITGSREQDSRIFPMIFSCICNRQLQKVYGITFFLLLTIMLFYGSFEMYVFTTWKEFTYSIQLLRLISLIGIVPAFFSSKLMNRFGAKSVLRFQLMVMAIGFSPAVFSINVTTIMVASLLMIASTSLTIPMVVLLVGKLASQFKSTALALYSFILLMGATVGSILAPAIGFPVVLVLIPIVFLVLTFFSSLLLDDNQ